MTNASESAPSRLPSNPPPSRLAAYVAVALWLTQVIVAIGWGPDLDAVWPAWRVAFWALAVWGLNLIVLYYGIGPPFTVSRIPVLSALFGFVMSVLGTGNYWATTRMFPEYRVFIERAALFVALCTLVSLLGCIIVRVMSSTRQIAPRRLFVWEWGKLRVVTYVLLGLCVLGTYVSIRRIGYVPLLQGDPESLRFSFPAIAGIWLRFSTQVGIVVGLVAGAQICARRATWLVWTAGILGVVCASMYGNRIFAALPAAAILLLWDQVRSRVSVRTGVGAFVAGVPILALLGYWRYQEAPLAVLSPLLLVLFGTLMEFRDLAWTMEHYPGAHQFLHGSTLGAMFMPVLPSPIWSLLGVDKGAVYGYSNSVVLAQEMWQVTPQRVGLYGELFMNFGWMGAFVGALIYGALLGYLDRRFLALRTGDAVRGIVLAVVAVAVIYAQVGQWDMDITAITSTCYPILLLALISARRRATAT